MILKDRRHAGRLLAEKVKKTLVDKNAIVFGITRGGVVVADEIARRLKLPLKIIVIKKIGAPLNPELAIGSIAPEGVVYWEESLINDLSVSEEYKKEAFKQKNKEREDLERFLINKKARIKISEKTILLVDDGVATGSTVLGAALYFRKKKAAKIHLLTPIIAKDVKRMIENFFDSIISIEAPARLNAVGQFYEKFDSIENIEVKDIIERQKI